MPKPPEIASVLIDKLLAGEAEATDELWQKCHAELMRFARKRLSGLPAKEEVAEEVALSALKSFMMRLPRGQFPELKDSSNVWRLLYTIAGRKAQRAYAKSDRQPRLGTEHIVDVEAVVDLMPGTIDELLGLLPDDFTRSVGRMKLGGFNNREIAEELGTYAEKVRRSVLVISATWQEQI